MWHSVWLSLKLVVLNLVLIPATKWSLSQEVAAVFRVPQTWWQSVVANCVAGGSSLFTLLNVNEFLRLVCACGRCDGCGGQEDGVLARVGAAALKLQLAAMAESSQRAAKGGLKSCGKHTYSTAQQLQNQQEFGANWSYNYKHHWPYFFCFFRFFFFHSANIIFVLAVFRAAAAAAVSNVTRYILKPSWRSWLRIFAQLSHSNWLPHVFFFHSLVGFFFYFSWPFMGFRKWLRGI